MRERICRSSANFWLARNSSLTLDSIQVGTFDTFHGIESFRLILMDRVNEVYLNIISYFTEKITKSTFIQRAMVIN